MVCYANGSCFAVLFFKSSPTHATSSLSNISITGPPTCTSESFKHGAKLNLRFIIACGQISDDRIPCTESIAHWHQTMGCLDIIMLSCSLCHVTNMVIGRLHAPRDCSYGFRYTHCINMLSWRSELPKNYLKVYLSYCTASVSTFASSSCLVFGGLCLVSRCQTSPKVGYA